MIALPAIIAVIGFSFWASQQSVFEETSLKRFDIDGRLLCAANCTINISYEIEHVKDRGSVRCDIVLGVDSSPEVEGFLLSDSTFDDIPITGDLEIFVDPRDYTIRLFADSKLLHEEVITLLIAGGASMVMVDLVRFQSRGFLGQVLMPFVGTGLRIKDGTGIGLCSKSTIFSITYVAPLEGILDASQNIHEMLIDTVGGRQQIARDVRIGDWVRLSPPIDVSPDMQLVLTNLRDEESEPPFEDGSLLGFRMELEVFCQE
jgi:hypothetical protein